MGLINFKVFQLALFALTITTALITNTASASICNRHPSIQEAILWELKILNCESVTDQMVAKLERLDLDQKINHISDDDLLGLHRLTNLYIQDRNLVTISDNAFKDLGQLRALYLGFNQIKTLNGKLLRPLISLRFLHLWRNPISDLDINAFENNRELILLSLTGTHLNGLPMGLFRNNKNLTELDLSNSLGLSSLDPSWFNDLSQLKMLSLTGLKIKTLPAELPVKIPNIEFLVLDDNELDESIFRQLAGLNNLKRLNIMANKFKSFRNADLKLLKSLENFKFGEFNLNHLEDNLFVDTSIKEVDVSSSPLLDTNAAAFRGVVVTGLPDGFQDQSGDMQSWD